MLKILLCDRVREVKEVFVWRFPAIGDISHKLLLSTKRALSNGKVYNNATKINKN